MVMRSPLMTALQTIATTMPPVMEVMGMVTPERVPAPVAKSPPSSEKLPRARQAQHTADHITDIDTHSIFKHNLVLLLFRKHIQSLKEGFKQILRKL